MEIIESFFGIILGGLIVRFMSEEWAEGIAFLGFLVGIENIFSDDGKWWTILSLVPFGIGWVLAEVIIHYPKRKI